MIQYYKTFRLFGFLIYLTLRVSDDGYSRNEPCALNWISMSLLRYLRENLTSEINMNICVYLMTVIPETSRAL